MLSASESRDTQVLRDVQTGHLVMEATVPLISGSDLGVGHFSALGCSSVKCA